MEIYHSHLSPPQVTAKKDGQMWQVIVHNPADPICVRLNENGLQELLTMIPDLIIIDSKGNELLPNI